MECYIETCILNHPVWHMFSIQIFRKNNSCDILRDIQGVYYHLSLYQMAVLFPTGSDPIRKYCASSVWLVCSCMNTLIHGNGPWVYLPTPTSMMPEVAKINNFPQSFKNPRAIFYFCEQNIFLYIIFIIKFGNFWHHGCRQYR